MSHPVVVRETHFLLDEVILGPHPLAIPQTALFLVNPNQDQEVVIEIWGNDTGGGEYWYPIQFSDCQNSGMVQYTLQPGALAVLLFSSLDIYIRITSTPRPPIAIKCELVQFARPDNYEAREDG